MHIFIYIHIFTLFDSRCVNPHDCTYSSTQKPFTTIFCQVSFALWTYLCDQYYYLRVALHLSCLQEDLSLLALLPLFLQMVQLLKEPELSPNVTALLTRVILLHRQRGHNVTQ